MNKKEIGVVLGRFSPLHKGHEALIGALIKKHKIAHSLVFIGSSEANTDGRTPYSFQTRKDMVQQRFPGILVLPLPDIGVTENDFKMTNGKWLDQISAIETKMQAQFVFYGGSQNDLKYLAERFKIAVLVDRKSIPITATGVRSDIANRVEIDEKVHADIIPSATKKIGEMPQQ